MHRSVQRNAPSPHNHTVVHSWLSDLAAGYIDGTKVLEVCVCVCVSAVELYGSVALLGVSVG